MRDERPVRYDSERRSWDVFRYEDVKSIPDDDGTFSVDLRTADDFEEPKRPGEGLIFDTMLFQDPPRHDELRGVVDEAFQPRAIADLEPRVRELTADLLDDALAGNGGEMDVVDDLAYPLPVTVIAELLGVPVAERDRFEEWSDTLVAGNITTTNLVANAVRCFADEDLFDSLRGDDAALRTALEEVLRYRSPVQAMTRIARTDVTMRDETIEAGDRVVVWLGSANRDERQFDAADSFVPDRSPNQHLGFGHGTHYCLGAPLARLETSVALSELLDRVGDVRFADTELRPTRSSFVYGIESLPIRYEARTEG